jgi:hypothetical protein
MAGIHLAMKCNWRTQCLVDPAIPKLFDVNGERSFHWLSPALMWVNRRTTSFGTTCICSSKLTRRRVYPCQICFNHFDHWFDLRRHPFPVLEPYRSPWRRMRNYVGIKFRQTNTKTCSQSTIQPKHALPIFVNTMAIEMIEKSTFKESNCVHSLFPFSLGPWR